MLSDILVTSNFPDVLSCNVEYTVSFQLLMDERREETLYYQFSNNTIVKRTSKTEETKTFFFDDLSLTFVLKEAGVHTFSLVLGKNVIYEKTFIVEEILDTFLYENEIQQPICIQKPKNVSIDMNDTIISFTCKEISFEEWLKIYYANQLKENNKVYCGMRYFAPERSTHWRIRTKSSKGVQDSGFVEFTHTDANMVDWYFPIAELSQDEICVTDKSYKQSIGFYIQCGNEYVELDHRIYHININYEKLQKPLNTNIWNEEILRLIYFIREGYQAKDLIRKYGAWHSLSEEEILSDIRSYKDNFGEFALNKGLIETTNQAILLNYATHYTLIDSIIKLGITDLKQTREDFQELMLQANKGICEVLPQIK